jgi:tRNA U54 and U55 pseudouridine synthase Pus10
MTGIKGGTAMKFDDFMKEIGEDTIETETIRQLAHMVSDIVKRRKMLGLTQDEESRSNSSTGSLVRKQFANSESGYTA